MPGNQDRSIPRQKLSLLMGYLGSLALGLMLVVNATAALNRPEDKVCSEILAESDASKKLSAEVKELLATATDEQQIRLTLNFMANDGVGLTGIEFLTALFTLENTFKVKFSPVAQYDSKLNYGSVAVETTPAVLSKILEDLKFLVKVNLFKDSIATNLSFIDGYNTVYVEDVAAPLVQQGEAWVYQRITDSSLSKAAEIEKNKKEAKEKLENQRAKDLAEYNQTIIGDSKNQRQEVYKHIEEKQKPWTPESEKVNEYDQAAKSNFQGRAVPPFVKFISRLSNHDTSIQIENSFLKKLIYGQYAEFSSTERKQKSYSAWVDLFNMGRKGYYQLMLDYESDFKAQLSLIDITQDIAFAELIVKKLLVVKGAEIKEFYGVNDGVAFDLDKVKKQMIDDLHRAINSASSK